MSDSLLEFGVEDIKKIIIFLILLAALVFLINYLTKVV